MKENALQFNIVRGEANFCWVRELMSQYISSVREYYRRQRVRLINQYVPVIVYEVDFDKSPKRKRAEADLTKTK